VSLASVQTDVRSNRPKEWAPPKSELINRLVRLSAGAQGCKFTFGSLKLVLDWRANKNGAGKTGAMILEQTPLTAGRVKRNAEEWSYLGS
jgi:hypothetical protein